MADLNDNTRKINSNNTQVALNTDSISGPLMGTNICIIGAGFVGCVAAAGFAKFGHNVVCVEKDTERAELLREGHIPFYEPELEALIKAGLESGRLTFSTDLNSSLTEQKAFFVTVGTPSLDDGRADLNALEEIIESISGKLNENQVLVLKSTVPIGTADKLKDLLAGRNYKNGIPSIVSNPEFLREGSAVYEFFNPQRIVIGGDDPGAIETVKNIYRLGMVESVPFVIANNKTAEMIKYASNVFLAMKIGYINEISRICDSLEVDVLEVARGIGYDRRIGGEFLSPGPGWGGSCLPKDLSEFLGLAKSNNVKMEILKSVQASNRHQHDYVVSKIKRLTGALSSKKIAVLGLSFKANTSDLRESPALKILNRLKNEGAVVSIYDPVADKNDPLLPPGIHWSETATAACENADCITLLTEWPEFQMLDWKRIAQSVKQLNIVDTRNLLFPENLKNLGFNYVSMGQL